jgi:hypothetical protein
VLVERWLGAAKRKRKKDVFVLGEIKIVISKLYFLRESGFARGSIQ